MIGKIAGTLLLLVAASGCAQQGLTIRDQGSFAVGGTVVPQPAGAPAFHGDHAYVFYQLPENARKHPLVFLHGAGQSSKTWESTPDGREGFQNLFLRRGFGVYLLDQPRRGRAGRSTAPGTIAPTPDERTWFNIFRVGVWPDYFAGVQFPREPEALNQYFRQMTPNTLEASAVSLADFMRLTRLPIVIYYGDNIPSQPMAVPSQDQWRTRLDMAWLWAAAVNRRGGDVTVVHLPESGIRGNTHFPFSDLNNVEIADFLSRFLRQKGLD
jgi:hypothetical protein